MRFEDLETYADFGDYLRERVATLKEVGARGASSSEPCGSSLPGQWNDEGLALLAVGMLGQSGNAAGVSVVREALVEAQGEAGFALLHAAIPIDGHGLAPAIALAAAESGVGASVSLSIAQSQSQVDDATALFDESGDAEVFAVPEEAIRAVAAAADAEGVLWSRIGTTGGDLLVFTGSGVIADGNGGVPLFLELSEL